MDGQVLGGGVIVLVAVLLWLVYLLPTWHARHQFDAAERNAVRLNQALRILAETSETPEEVRLELNARTALQQQKLAKRVQAERESAELEDLRASLLAAKHAPAARRARARRRARLVATVLLLAGLGLTGWGVWQTVVNGAQLFVWVGAGVALTALVVLQRMTAVQARAARRAADAAAGASADASSEADAAIARGETDLQDLVLEERGNWTPRPLPRPLASADGSRAARVLAAADAREALQRAAREEALRERAERLRPAPTPITAGRRPAAAVGASGLSIDDDAAIEAHVRDLLSRRAAGE